MTKQEAKYLQEGMKVNYSEPIQEAYKERARSMVEDVELFEDILDNSVIMNIGRVIEIIDEENVLISRNTFSGDVTEVIEISRLKYNEEDQNRIDKITKRENNINNILD